MHRQGKKAPIGAFFVGCGKATAHSSAGRICATAPASSPSPVNGGRITTAALTLEPCPANAGEDQRLPDVHPILRLEVELLAGLGIERLVPGVDVAHGLRAEAAGG